MYNDHINSKFALMGFRCEFTEKNVCEFCVSLFQMQQSMINPVRVVHNRPEYVPIKFGCTMAEGKEDLFDIIKAMEIEFGLDACLLGGDSDQVLASCHSMRNLMAVWHF